MFGRNDFIENIKDALAAAGCDMGAFRSWQKQYDRLKKKQKEQIAQRSHRADEHDERKPEHDAPEAPALLLFLLGIGILCGSHEASPFDIDLST